MGLILGREIFWGCLGNKFGADLGWARLGDALETNLKLILGGGKFKKVSWELMWGRTKFKGDMLQNDNSLVKLYWHGFHLHTNKFELLISIILWSYSMS